VPGEPKQINVTRRWLAQHTVPAKAKPDSMPRLEGGGERWKYSTCCSPPTNPAFPALMHTSAHTYQFPSSPCTSILTVTRSQHSALRSRSRLDECLQWNRKKEKPRVDRKFSDFWLRKIYSPTHLLSLDHWFHSWIYIRLIWHMATASPDLRLASQQKKHCHWRLVRTH